MARAVVPCTAAAVDHADTELIGHHADLRYRVYGVTLIRVLGSFW